MRAVRDHALQPIAWEIIVAACIFPRAIHPRVGGRFGSNPRMDRPIVCRTLEIWLHSQGERIRYERVCGGWSRKLSLRLGGIRWRVRDESADNAVVLPYAVSMPFRESIPIR